MSEDFFDDGPVAPKDIPAAQPSPTPAAPPRKASARSRRRGAAGTTPDAILRGIELSRELASAESFEVTTLSGMLGCPDSPDHVAAAIASGGKADTSAIDALVGIAEATSPFEAGVRAHSLTEDRRAFARVWDLAGVGGEPTRDNLVAAGRLAEVVHQMSQADLDRISGPKRFLG